ncbi:MAG: ATP-dependent RecD-like DNA helicase [Clostridiales Family XIII bacterium]|jgi:exodeoxyribonuclease V alpha subunit|nr:ATP-dependent RecD-like DNA helicase [Clostridiales Family XIII bacterium]
MQIEAKMTFRLYPKLTAPFNQGDFAICSYKPLHKVLFQGKEVNSFSIKGTNIPLIKGVKYILDGEFIIDKTYVNFSLKSFTEKEGDKVSDANALTYLKGVGPKTGVLLISHFGSKEKVFEAIEKNPLLLIEAGIKREKAIEIGLDFKKKEKQKNNIIYLSSLGIKSAEKIIANLNPKYSLENEVKKNPYFLFFVIPNFHFATTENIAKKLGFKHNFPGRIIAGIMEAIKCFERGSSSAKDLVAYGKTGNTLVELEELVKMVDTFLNPKDFSISIFPEKVEDGEIYSCIKTLRNKEKLVEIKENGKIFLQRTELFDLEEGISKYLKKMNKKGLLNDKKKNKAKIFLKGMTTPTLADEQIEACLSALDNGISVITGGPGTGKTTLCNALIKTYKYLYKKNVRCLSPTGKAAKNLKEKVGNGRTIHSVLAQEEISKKPILQNDSFIIIDEVSMLDTFVMFNFIKSAYNPHERTPKRIVFVGDKDQLPPVDIGACLEALLEAKSIPTVSLVKTFRQEKDSSIITNALKIRDGKTDLVFNNEDFFFIQEQDSEKIRNLAILSYLRLEEKGEDVVLLSPLRVAKDYIRTTSEELNLFLRDKLNPKIDGDEVFHIPQKNLDIRKGDKIMYLKNEKIEKDKNITTLTNGDIGLVIDSKKDGISVIFSDTNSKTPVFLDADNGVHVNLAYSMSIHKSQGSEYETVIMIIDPLHRRMLKRNLIYTGITRAKKRCVIIGDKNTLDVGIETVETGKRKSMLLSHLNKPLEKEPIPVVLPKKKQTVKLKNPRYKPNSQKSNQMSLFGKIKSSWFNLN